MESRIALVHDYLLVMRGAERTFAAMSDLWPHAPVHTTIFDPDGTEGRFAGREVHTTYLQRLGVRQAGFRRLLPLFPRAVASLDLSGADTIVSSSSAFAHGIRRPSSAVHVCYCHSPFRYAWHERDRALLEVPRPARPLLGAVLDRQRAWDLERARDVTVYLANGRVTQRRIADFYGREAEIVHPPVDVGRFAPAEAADWFLLVGEIVSHKRVEIVLDAVRRAGATARVVGDGPDRDRLARLHPEATFLGRVDDAVLADLYARCRALLVGNVEEFGITAVEAQAAGRPVVAPAAGGAAETVVDGRTGVLLDDPTVDAYAAAIRSVDFDRFDAGECARSAERFSVAAFQQRLAQAVTAAARG